MIQDWVQTWSLTDGHAGNARQALALATALAPHAPRAWTLDARAPWRWLSPRQLPGARRAFGPEFAAALARPPGLAIGCGRQAALATRLLRHGGARVVQILDPRLDPRHWDLVVAPLHDGLRGDNVIAVLGSLHPVDDAWLAQGREAFPELGELPRPRTAVLLGGPSAHLRFGLAEYRELAARLEPVVRREGGSVLLTTSRRTDPAVSRAVAARGIDLPGMAWLGPGDDRPNPYAGILGWADRIVCSADSVNMLSEACATRVPVAVFEPQLVRGRPRLYLDALLSSGRIRPLDDALAPFAVEPLRETARVAAEVRERLRVPG